MNTVVYDTVADGTMVTMADDAFSCDYLSVECGGELGQSSEVQSSLWEVSLETFLLRIYGDMVTSLIRAGYLYVRCLQLYSCVTLYFTFS